MKSIVLFAEVLRIIIITALIGFTIFANAQNVAVNTTGNPADESAMLDISSTSKGFLPPRMTTVQRTGIPLPANGLMVFDTDTKTYWYYSDSWKEVINAGGGGGFILPYSGSSDLGDKVFSITSNSSSNSRVAIYGRGSNVFTGLIPSDPTGVWGEEDSGIGVLGTSKNKYGVFGHSTNSHGVYGFSASQGWAAVFGRSNNAQGIGVKGYIPNGGIAVVGEHDGNNGNAGKFITNNVINNATTVDIITTGAGRALEAKILNSNNNAEVVNFFTSGLGGVVGAHNLNVSNTADVASISTNGLGRALYANISNANNTENVIRINTQGKGDPVYVTSNTTSSNWLIKGEHSGLGGGLYMTLLNQSTTGDVIRIGNKGHGAGIRATSENNAAGIFVNANNANISSAILTVNLGMTSAGEFNIVNPQNSSEVLSVSTDGTGPGIMINNTNTNVVNSLATFKRASINKARIDGNGKGFFNGGTQTGGADLAEAFDVIGNIDEYEAGDVLIISIDQDRTVEKSSGPYSTLVAGVYATKPGVLLTEEDIETDISDKVPMGVVGVIPTKVCLEGGEIKRGDLLVTSSVPGVAMKAAIETVKPGQVIGKALENFNSSSTGKIRVLVNVK
jgi:hypothetical protein